METLISIYFLIAVVVALVISFIIRSFGNIRCKWFEKKLLRSFKENHKNLRNLMREYRYLVEISKKINSKKYTVYYDKDYWNEVIDYHKNEIAKQSFGLFRGKLYEIHNHLDLLTFLNMISYNAGVKPELIESFVRNYKETLISEIIARETNGYEEKQKEIFSETLKHQIEFSLQ